VRVVYADRALGQLEAIRDWLAAEAGADIARRIVRELLDRCDSLSDFPRRGTPEDAIRPGLPRFRIAGLSRSGAASMARP
jgi:toxin ParE1/3/4